MDPLTHSLSGIIGANIIKKKWKRDGVKYAYLFFLGSILPDIDYVSRFFGTAYYLRYHRGITHSFVFALIFSLSVSRIIQKLRKDWTFSKGASVLFLGIVCHIYLDLITSFGTEILLPLSRERFHLDWVFVIDPIFTISLLIGCMITMIFKRFEKALVLLVILYPLCCGFVKHEVVERTVYLKSETTVTILPEFLAPYFWKAVYDKGGYLEIRRISVFGPNSGSNTLRYCKANIKELAKASERFSDLKILLRFYRFPVVLQEKGRNGMSVIADARFITTWRRSEKTLRVPFLFVVYRNNLGQLVDAKFL